MTDSTAVAVRASTIETLDQTWAQVTQGLAGLTQAEYLWEPALNCWTIFSGDDGLIEVDWSAGDPGPAPVTTIAWRMWHIAVDCLDGYASRLGNGTTGVTLTGKSWVADSAEAAELLTKAWTNFYDLVVSRTPEQFFELLGESWGQFATSTFFDLVLHAQREVVHHGAEISLLLDLHRSGAMLG